MALETVQSGLSNTASLFRPRPVNELQSNLAQFYERTSEFVDHHFKEMSDATSSEKKNSKLQNGSSEESLPRLNPKGLGLLVDLVV